MSTRAEGEASAMALAKYLREASDAAERSGHRAIMVSVPKPFALQLVEARAIADRIDPPRLGGSELPARWEKLRRLTQSMVDPGAASNVRGDVLIELLDDLESALVRLTLATAPLHAPQRPEGT